MVLHNPGIYVPLHWEQSHSIPRRCYGETVQNNQSSTNTSTDSFTVVLIPQDTCSSVGGVQWAREHKDVDGISLHTWRSLKH